MSSIDTTFLLKCNVCVLALAVIAYTVASNEFTTPMRFIDIVYFAIVTQSTVGYGDICPKSEWARLSALLHIMLSLLVNVGEIVDSKRGATNLLSSVPMWIPSIIIALTGVYYLKYDNSRSEKLVGSLVCIAAFFGIAVFDVFRQVVLA